ncbi:hypothetical protein ACFL2C_01980 [Patescibacteria group bacterium]
MPELNKENLDAWLANDDSEVARWMGELVEGGNPRIIIEPMSLKSTGHPIMDADVARSYDMKPIAAGTLLDLPTRSSVRIQCGSMGLNILANDASRHTPILDRLRTTITESGRTPIGC